MIIEVKNESQTIKLGEAIGEVLCGGEIIELIGDVGTGKTTLVKGIASGLEIDEYIQSPSFTINRIYGGRDNITLSHYDFYRLEDAGIMANELQEVVCNPDIVTIIEWGGVVDGILPKDRLAVNISAPAELSRKFDIRSNGNLNSGLEGKIKL